MAFHKCDPFFIEGLQVVRLWKKKTIDGFF